MYLSHCEGNHAEAVALLFLAICMTIIAAVITTLFWLKILF